MRANATMFWILAGFFLLSGIAYTIWSIIDHATNPHPTTVQPVEWVGTIGIGLAMALSILIAFYLNITKRAQGGELPEDRLDAAIDDGDPEVGHFSPWSWWPMFLALGLALMFLGLAVGIWVTFIGAPIVLVAVVGWNYEYYRNHFAREHLGPMSDPIVRPARPEDRDGLFALVPQLGHPRPVDRAAFDQTVTGYLEGEQPGAFLFVVDDGSDTIGGYALTTVAPLLSTNGPSAQIQEIAVTPGARGNGYGTLLVRAVEAECQRRGVTQLTVASRRAGGFYDRLGYQENAEYMRRLF